MAIAVPIELGLVWAGMALTLTGTVLAWREASRSPATVTVYAFGSASLAMALIAAGLGLRWLRLGHGPFFTLSEILASNVLSLGVLYLLACTWIAPVRAAAPVALTVLSTMAVWSFTVPSPDSHFAPTYATPLLWVHVGFGKLFLGTALIALALAGVILVRNAMRRTRGATAAFRTLPDDTHLDKIAWQVMRVALVFESAMLVAGAVWAQDAWGRYWAWDPLEAWSLLTWLVLALALHLRRVVAVTPIAGAWLVWLVFGLAFLTFFGVPFISDAPHRGAV